MSPYEWATVILLGLNLCAFGLYLLLQARQVTLMRDTAENARKQLETTDRAWLKADAEISESVTFVDRGAQFTFRLTLTNIGRSVATNVHGLAEVVVPISDPNRPLATQVEKEQNAISGQLEDMANTPGAKGNVLFPAEVQTIKAGGFVSIKEIEAGAFPLKDFPGKFFEPLLVGCVIYQLPNSDQFHRTRFAYNIYRKLPDIRWAVFEPGKDVASSDMFLNRLWGGGNSAN